MWTTDYVQCGNLEYEVSLLPSPRNDRRNKTVTRNHDTFSKLHNDTLYVIEVSATNRAGKGNTLSKNVKTPRSKRKLYMYVRKFCVLSKLVVNYPTHTLFL